MLIISLLGSDERVLWVGQVQYWCIVEVLAAWSSVYRNQNLVPAHERKRKGRVISCADDIAKRLDIAGLQSGK